MENDKEALYLLTGTNRS